MNNSEANSETSISCPINKKLKFVLIFSLQLIFFTSASYAKLAPLLSFSELEQAIDDNDRRLNSKIEKLIRSHHLDNKIGRNRINFTSGKYKEGNKVGKYISVATWNIEKSVNVLELTKILKSSSPENFFASSKKKNREALRQFYRFKYADVIFLQEMDYGVNRSKYLFAAKELAKALGMNFTYAPQQLEIDPYLLQTNLTSSNMSEHKNRYKGMFGVAILSRFKISNVQNIPFKFQAYDWFKEEKFYTPKDVVEKIRVEGADKVLGVHIQREIKRGKRGFLRADIDIPEIPEGKLTLVNVHLEIKTKPEGRRKQMQEVLEYIKDINNPVVMAGDFNSTNGDAEYQTSYKIIKKVLSDPSTYLSLAASAIGNPVVTILNRARKVVNILKNFRNPISLHIPVVLPNKSKAMFKDIFDFKFSDGYVFDLRGSELRSIGRDGHLSNSNQKAYGSGFKTSFEVPEPKLVFGREKLDWIFVKSYSRTNRLSNHVSSQSYRLAPHFAETLDKFNSLVKSGRISDHHPLIVDLPICEPNELNELENKVPPEKKRKEAWKKRIRRRRR